MILGNKHSLLNGANCYFVEVDVSSPNGILSPANSTGSNLMWSASPQTAPQVGSVCNWKLLIWAAARYWRVWGCQELPPSWLIDCMEWVPDTQPGDDWSQPHSSSSSSSSPPYKVISDLEIWRWLCLRHEGRNQVYRTNFLQLSINHPRMNQTIWLRMLRRAASYNL